jgi:hypothetical protein
MLDESLDLFRQVGDEPGVAQVLTMLVMRDAQAGQWDRVIAGLEEAVATWRRMGGRLHLAFDLVWLAFANGRVGRHAEGRSAALEALTLFREADNPTGIGIALIDLAFLATWEGRHTEALKLAGAYESLRERVGGPPGAIGGIMEGDPGAEALEHLPEDVARQAWEEGRAMSLEEAVALARVEAEA